MSFLNDLFNPSAGYDAAQGQLDKYYKQGQDVLNPYNEFGKTAGGNLQTAAGKLMDPAALRQEWENSYSLSPEAKQTQNMATQKGLESAESMGLLGSSSALRGIQSGTANIGLQDKSNYLNDLMNKYTTGINTNSGLFNTGANAASGLANLSSNMGQNSADMAYGSHSSLNSLLGNLAGGTAGYFLGGPSGALKMLMGPSAR